MNELLDLKSYLTVLFVLEIIHYWFKSINYVKIVYKFM